MGGLVAAGGWVVPAASGTQVPSAASPESPSPAAQRAAALGIGINVPHWFWIGGSTDDAYTKGYFTRRDADQLAALGVKHVRIPVAPGYLWDSESSTLRPGPLAIFREAINTLNAAGLIAIVDPHYSDEITPWLREGAASGRCEKLERFWGGLAAALADTPPDRVLLEVLNEPHDLKPGADGASPWHPMQQAVVRVIRAAAPQHTIIVTGDEWGGINGLLKLAPIDDPNLIYSFHFYEPMTFTHQAANWGAPNWKHLNNVPYPATEASIQAVAGTIADDAARGELSWYLGQKWDGGKIAAEIGRAAAWSKANGVPVYCGEFGVHRRAAPDAARGRWLGDVVRALRSHNIPGAMWDYHGGFALMDGATFSHASGEPRPRVPNVIAAHALGLRLPSPKALDPGGLTATPPPADAVVLFDGTSMDAWRALDGSPAPWTAENRPGGVMTIAPGKGSITTAEKFADAQIHVEFRIPPESGQGQDRGNSGVYVSGRYEVQVLDSWKSETYPEGQCGALYGQHVPLVNAARPPGEWQSYDIVFRAPRFDAAGRRTAPARLTVLHNGVLIHDAAPLAGPTGGAALSDERGPGPILLQDHGHAVQFRNIWVRPLPATP